MPWFPEFTSAVELARRQTRAAGQADPVAQYLAALNSGDAHVLETVWPGEVVVYDPRAGEVRGHRQLRRFVSRNQSWLAERHVRTETVASTCAGGRAVVELLAHLADDGRDLAWPVAVVAESPDDRPPRHRRAPLVLHHVLRRRRRPRSASTMMSKPVATTGETA
jgi:ketosteroid isomerase-like protein